MFSRNREKYFYVVNSNSPARNFYISNIPKNKIINIDCKKHRAGIFYDREIASLSDLNSQLEQKKINAFWPFDKPSPKLQKWAFSKKIKLLSPKWDLQKKLENKVFFERFLRKNNISSPEGWIIENADDIKKINKYPAVLQVPYSQGARGTFVIKNASEVQNIIHDKKLKFPLLCRKFIEGIPLGVTLLIGKHDMIFSSIRMQAIEKDLNGYMGIQWVRSDFFAKPVLAKLNKILLALGKNLRETGYIGAANVDIIIKNKNIFIIECNPRLSLSSMQLTCNRKLFHGLDFIEEFIRAVCGRRLNANKPKIPNTIFEGCTLDLDFLGPDLYKHKVQNPLQTGVYGLKNKKITYLTDDIDDFIGSKNIFIYGTLDKKQIMTKKTDFGFLMINDPLFKVKNKLDYLKTGQDFFSLLKNLFLSVI